MCNKSDHIVPPKWPLKLLRFIIKEKYLEEIEGDMEERFQDNLKLFSTKKARLLYVWDTLKLLRPSLIKGFERGYRINQYGMIRSNVKNSLRIFFKSKLYSSINILSISSGLTIAMLILLYVKFELSYENKNPISDRVVRITMDYLSGKTLVEQVCQTYHPSGPRIASEFSEVTDFTRAYPIEESIIKVGDDFFREPRIYAVDPAFFNLFSYPLLQGDPGTVFSNPFEVVLTESQALAYFKRKDVVGESLRISGFDKDFKVSGIIRDNPPNTHLKFKILISYSSIKAAFGEKRFLWNNNTTYTYLLLSHPNQYENFLVNLRAFNDRLHKENKILNEKIVAQPVRNIHLYSHKTEEAEQNGDATSVFFLLGVAIMVILIAVVNYINLSTSKSLDRAKEVGIRKVVGASLSQLKVQFFTESFIINLFAGLVAIGLMLVSLPAFRNMSGLPSDFHFWNDLIFWCTITSIIVISTLVSGIFPAFILSSFKPLQVLKGKFSHSAKGTILRKALVIFQFSITIFLLIQTYVTERQLSYMRGKELGLDIERTIVVLSPDDNSQRQNYQLFKNELLMHTEFQSVTLSHSVPGQPSSKMSSTNVGVDLINATEEQSFNFYINFIDADFIPAMRMELKVGENFHAENQGQEKILVNEEAIKIWGIHRPEEAINQAITLWGKQRTIIGVVKNFHQGSAGTAYIPMIFIHNAANAKLASIRTQSGNIQKHLDSVKEIYESFFPNSPFNFFFLDQEFDKQYRNEERFQQVFGTLTGFAVLIACLGLFGLVSFTVANKTKEIGVRKVLGASITQIICLLSKDFIALLLIAMTISISITYFLIQSWLEKYTFRIDLSIWFFVGPTMGVLMLSVLIVFLKTFQVSSANPADSLRDE